MLKSTFYIMVLFCASCDSNEHHTDLDLFIQQTLSEGINISFEPFQLPNYQSQTFSPSIDRDPFSISFQIHENSQSQNCWQPEKIPELELFNNQSLSNLFFKGIIQEKEQNWALVMAADNAIYRIAEGQVIGADRGLVERIDTQGISIIEHILDEAGCWHKKHTTLTMNS